MQSVYEVPVQQLANLEQSISYLCLSFVYSVQEPQVMTVFSNSDADRLIGLFGYVPARYLSGGVPVPPIGTVYSKVFYGIVSSICSLAVLVRWYIKCFNRQDITMNKILGHLSVGPILNSIAVFILPVSRLVETFTAYKPDTPTVSLSLVYIVMASSNDKAPEITDGEKPSLQYGQDESELSPQHREYLLQRHGTLNLDPRPSADDADPYNWPPWKVRYPKRARLAGYCRVLTINHVRKGPTWCSWLSTR